MLVVCHLLASLNCNRVGALVFFLIQDDKELGKEKALKDWNNEVENILQILVSNFNEELRDTYLTTAVEQVRRKKKFYLQFFQ